MVAWVRWGSGTRRGARRGGVDPFCTLEVQFGLARLEREIGQLLAGTAAAFAQGHHLRAAQLAYDELLMDACQLADVPGLPEERQWRRLVAEAELRTRGWTW
jgi:hypothetical protein